LLSAVCETRYYHDGSGCQACRHGTLAIVILIVLVCFVLVVAVAPIRAIRDGMTIWFDLTR